MPEFTFTLNFHIQARDAEQALEIAQEVKKFLEHGVVRPPVKFHSEIEIDDVEEL